MSDAIPAPLDVQALMALGVALDRLDGGGVRDLVELALLARAFPQWAMWRRTDGVSWIATRPAGSMQPGPEAPAVWVRAGTAAELADRMQAANTGLSPDWGL